VRDASQKIINIISNYDVIGILTVMVATLDKLVSLLSSKFVIGTIKSTVLVDRALHCFYLLVFGVDPYMYSKIYGFTQW